MNTSVHVLDFHKTSLYFYRNKQHREQTCGCQGGRGGMDWEFGISRCKLLYIDWIDNKALLYITENYIQYPVTNHNRKEYEKRIYICITESLCCTAEINTTL